MLTAKKRSVVGLIVVFAIALLTTLIATAIYVFGVIGWDGLTTRAERTLWHERSRNFIAALRPELSKEEVIKIAQEHGFPKNYIYKQDSEIRVYTPLELGASNWVIRLKFLDNKLTYAKVRMDDNIYSDYRPRGAPEDIVYSPNIINE